MKRKNFLKRKRARQERVLRHMREHRLPTAEKSIRAAKMNINNLLKIEEPDTATKLALVQLDEIHHDWIMHAKQLRREMQTLQQRLGK